jgi:hypothetical protein
MPQPSDLSSVKEWKANEKDVEGDPDEHRCACDLWLPACKTNRKKVEPWGAGRRRDEATRGRDAGCTETPVEPERTSSREKPEEVFPTEMNAPNDYADEGPHPPRVLHDEATLDAAAQDALRRPRRSSKAKADLGLSRNPRHQRRPHRTVSYGEDVRPMKDDEGAWAKNRCAKLVLGR